jgi:hypothetical protein
LANAIRHFLSCVGLTVQLNHQFAFRAVEIDYVFPNDVLPSEFESREPTTPQLAPEDHLSGRLLAAQLACPI